MRNANLARMIALVTPLALLAGAYSFQYVGGLFPCEMCWWQRYAHFAALGFAVLAFVPAFQRLMTTLAGVGIAASGLIGAYHAGVEYGWWKGLTECTSAITFGSGGNSDPLAAIMAAPLIRCDVVQWKMFGISMAGYNALVSSIMALAIFALLARQEKQA